METKGSKTSLKQSVRYRLGTLLSINFFMLRFRQHAIRYWGKDGYPLIGRILWLFFFTPSLWCTLWCTIQATFHSALSHATVSQQSDTGQHLQFLRCLVKCSHSSSINIQGWGAQQIHSQCKEEPSINRHHCHQEARLYSSLTFWNQWRYLSLATTLLRLGILTLFK